jgi:hypothetical protein
MDLGFLRRAELRFAGRAPAALDFGMFVAALQAQQAANGVRAPVRKAEPRMAEPIVEILLAGPGWREAVAAQGGCFNSAFARKGSVN